METMKLIWESIRSFFVTNIFDVLKTIQWIDVIDILLFAVILYGIFCFIRERRAFKLIIGMCLILLLAVVGDFLKLKAVGFVFGDFRQLGLIAILIIFQPELRSALEKVGGTPLSGLRTITSDSKSLAMLNAEIEAICSAASDLSRDKVGALIVIERSTRLGEYINSGVSIDAAISPHILKNLFFNKAPLHDGAVIVRNGRVYAAGCFLPLTTRDDLDNDLGTRHRAALGVAEISDAVVVVVSEETGVISLAHNGNLDRNFNYTSLKQALNGYLTPSNQSDAQKKKHKKQKNISSEN
jgi:diadenylate cyclase